MTVVPPRDGNHQAQVRVDHLRLGFVVAALDALCEIDLLVGCQQVEAVDLAQKELQRVRRDGSQRLGLIGHLLRHVAPAVVLELRAGGIDAIEQRVDLRLGQVAGLHQLVDFGKLDAAGLLALLEECLQALRPLPCKRAVVSLSAPHLGVVIPRQADASSHLFAS